MTLFQQRVLWNFSRLRSRHKIRFLTKQLSQSLHWHAHTPKEQSGVKHEKCEELKVLIKHLRITSYWPYERTNENSCNFGVHFKSCRDGLSVVHPLFPVLPPFLDGQTVLFSTWSCQRTHQPFQMCSPPSSLHHSLCLISQQLLRPDVLPETHLVKVSLKIIALYDSPSGHLLSLRKSLGCRGCTAQFSHH